MPKHNRQLVIAILFLTLAGTVLAQFDDWFVGDVPYVPTPEIVVDAMLELAEVTADDVVYDLGCGDGRIVITAAKKRGARGVGIDLNPERVLEANANAKAAGVTDRVEFREGDLFKAEISDATVVMLYLLTSVNEKLKPKLVAELKPGTRVVSHRFSMGDWEPEIKTEADGRPIYLWRVPEHSAASAGQASTSQ